MARASAERRTLRDERARPSASRIVGQPTTSIGMFQVGRHAADDPKLLPVLLAEIGAVGHGHPEKLGHDCRHARRNGRGGADPPAARSAQPRGHSSRSPRDRPRPAGARRSRPTSSGASRAASAASVRGYLARSSALLNCLGLTKIVTITRGPSRNAARTRLRCPSCSAPMSARRPRCRLPPSSPNAVAQVRHCAQDFHVQPFAPGASSGKIARVRKGPRAHLGGIGRHRLFRRPSELGIALDEFRTEVGKESQHVIHDQHLPVTGSRSADADGRDRHLGGDRPAQAFGHLLDHDREGAGACHRLGIGTHPGGILRAALHLVAAEGVHPLRRQPDMAHHRDPAGDEEGDGLGHVQTAPSFTAAAPVSTTTRAALRKACSGPSS